MAKDPAFLFYSKDWLEGTAEMMPDEKGIYIDLLAYQHQRGTLPANTQRLARLVGLQHDEFLELWEQIQTKFKPAQEPTNEQTNQQTPQRTPKRIYNERLNEVMGERSRKGHRNKIIGIFSGLIRKQKLSAKNYNFIKTAFKVEDFEHLPSERLNDRLNEWFIKCLKSIENENVNENVNNKENKGKSENEKFNLDFVQKSFLPLVNEFIRYRRQDLKQPYKTAQGIKQFYNNLVKLSGNDPQAAKKIIEYAQGREWLTVYEIKTQTNGAPIKKGIGRDSDF